MAARADNGHRAILKIISNFDKGIRHFRQNEIIFGDLTFQQFMILMEVEKAGALYMKDLHMKLMVEKSTTTRLLSPLIQRGFLKRHAAAHDSRAAVLALTEAGRKTLVELSSCVDRCCQELEMRIPESKRPCVFESLKVFADALKSARITPQGKKKGRCC